MLCYQCQSLQLLDNPTQRRDYTIQERVIVSNSCQSSQDTRPTSWGGLNQRWWVQSWWLIRSKPAVLPVLRARGKCAVVREEISKRGKLLRCLCALTRTVKTLARPPVQVSAADSWGFPDIDLFLSACCRPPTPRCMTDALSNTDAVQKGFTPTHARLGRTQFTVG